MTKTRRMITLGAAGLVAAGGAAAATSAALAAARPIDGDADLRAGATLRLEAETRADAKRVTFLYGGKRYAARMTEHDREDSTKDWTRDVPALKSDRAAGKVATFRVRACDVAGDCATRKFSERLEWDD